MKNIKSYILIILFSTMGAQVITVQGVLRDNNNAAISDGTYTMTFEIFDSQSGGDSLWPTDEPEEQDVTVINGVYSLGLNIGTSIQSSGSELWLEVTVNGEPMNERVRLHVSPYEQIIMENQSNVFPVSGNVGIGTGGSTPSSPLTVVGDISATGDVLVTGRIDIADNLIVGGDGSWSPPNQIWAAGDPGIPIDEQNGASFSNYSQINLVTQSETENGGKGNLKIGYDPAYGPFGVGFIKTVVPNIYNSPLSLNPFGGNVGIGTAAPNTTLHVAGPLNIDNRFKFSSDYGIGHLTLTGDNSMPHLYIYGDENGGGTGEGNQNSDFAIVLKSPTVGPDNIDFHLWLNSSGVIHATELIDSDHGNYNLKPYGTSNLAVLNVEVLADVLSSISNDDDRIQYRNIENINTSILNKFSALQPVSFTAEIDGNEVNSFGFRDENLRDISPELIRESESITREDGSVTSSSTGLDVTSLAVQSVGAINELKTEKDLEIDELKKTIEKLIKRIEKLENK